MLSKCGLSRVEAAEVEEPERPTVDEVLAVDELEPPGLEVPVGDVAAGVAQDVVCSKSDGHEVDPALVDELPLTGIDMRPTRARRSAHQSRNGVRRRPTAMNPRLNMPASSSVTSPGSIGRAEAAHVWGVRTIECSCASSAMSSSGRKISMSGSR